MARPVASRTAEPIAVVPSVKLTVPVGIVAAVPAATLAISSSGSPTLGTLAEALVTRVVVAGLGVLTVMVITLLLDALAVAVAAKAAVMVWVPAVRVDTLSVAVPVLSRLAMPSEAAPSEKVTVPAAAAPPGSLVTAVSTTLAPVLMVVAEAVKPVVVAAGATGAGVEAGAGGCAATAA